MTRKDLEMIARNIRCRRAFCKTPVEFALIDQLAKDFASELAMTNPRFDKERFLDACK